jgi:hypothetical protein
VPVQAQTIGAHRIPDDDQDVRRADGFVAPAGERDESDCGKKTGCEAPSQHGCLQSPVVASGSGVEPVTAEREEEQKNGECCAQNAAGRASHPSMLEPGAHSASDPEDQEGFELT